MTLAWDKNPGSDIAGYKMHYGTTSGSYDYSVDVGNYTSCTISGLEEGTTYYFAVTAYNNDDNESNYSDEVAYNIPIDNSSEMLDSTTTYEDAEDGTINGWEIYDSTPGGAAIKNVYDNDLKSRVIQLVGSGTENGYRLRNDDGTDWQNSSQFVLQWSMKFSEDFVVYIDAETASGHRYILYSPVDVNHLGNGVYVHHGLGNGMADGRWHTIVRDLQADLEDAQPGVQILEVNAFLIRGSGKVDDIYAF